MAPNIAGKFFFRPIQTLPTFWATWIWTLRILSFEIVLNSEFEDFQVPIFPTSGLGQAGPGLSHLDIFFLVFLINIDVLACDRLFRLGETRASVTKYWFLKFHPQEGGRLDAKRH